jgi:hypothetical protein
VQDAIHRSSFPRPQRPRFPDAFDSFEPQARSRGDESRGLAGEKPDRAPSRAPHSIENRGDDFRSVPNSGVLRIDHEKEP